ncbi:hypothetical protein L227DRAFT_572916 [Lentinus tigrinus ALCF2SS1-6]|uniref:Uncharacterized protein n=1 Tax=Lentinus tigrinus ALCF2SS1-6 TaxID=1328759 RepID=A0A5C2SIU9_9APHY|nr:hypothetical protein L227DRAFT_572916 [Lentinus tigrinus ALCF2SS1-6]
MVLVHLHGALPPGLSRLLSSLLPRFLLSFFICLIASAHIPLVAAQTSVSNGLSVLDSPAPNAVLAAGSNASVAIDVSLGTSGTFVYNSLEVYLVSSATTSNVTVSAGPQLLTQEPGSTVKHIDWLVPTCLQTGSYNLTLYESSTLNGTSYFSIMPIPVQLRNNGVVNTTCTSPVNTLQVQPQPSSPPPANLIAEHGNPSSSTAAASSFSASVTSTVNETATGSATATLLPNSTLTSATTQATGGGIITVTASGGEITIPLSDLPGTIVVEPSGGAPPDTSSTVSSGFITIFKTVAPTATSTLTEIISQPVTVTLEETFVSTFTAPGQTVEFTLTQTLLSTVELVATQTVSSPGDAGLLPVNAAAVASPLSAIALLWTLSVSAFCYVLRASFAL